MDKFNRATTKTVQAQELKANMAATSLHSAFSLIASNTKKLK